MKTMIRFILLITFCLSTSYAVGPAPFGFEIGKTTLKEVQDKMNGKIIGINKYSDGKMLKVYQRDVPLDGVNQNAIFIFSKEDTLLYVQLGFSKDYFDELLSQLSSKYTLVKKEIPFVGDKYAELKSDDVVIILNAPHMSFDLTLFYVDTKFYKKVNSDVKEEEKQQLEKQKSAL